jgi:DUF917 family protein
MFSIGAEDLPDLALGASLLGTGGGGDPTIGRLLVQQSLGPRGRITILDPDELDDDAIVIPTALMGAPSVLIELLPNGREPTGALEALERYAGVKATATMPIECGGVNSMIPLVVAANRGIPVVDADGMGRAFPELQMETFAVNGINGSPLAIADKAGRHAILETGTDNVALEQLARALTVSMGGVAYIAEYMMYGHEVKRTAVPRTLSTAIRLGRVVREARSNSEDPIAALQGGLLDTPYGAGTVLLEGKVVDVHRRVVSGFTRGTATLRSLDGRAQAELSFQNEYLTVSIDGVTRALVPDLITVLQLETAEPITVEALRYGQRVCVFGIGAPEALRTTAALRTFGPAAFGIDATYASLEALVVL